MISLLSLEYGRVISIIYENSDIQIIEVVINSIEKAINYIDETGPVKKGDEVILNTAAVRLNLGTGGYHFVYFNRSAKLPLCELNRIDGHIIKMKYTLQQQRYKTIEENPEYCGFFDDGIKFKNRPVLIESLHSMLFPSICGIKQKKPDARITVIYTYGGSMNAGFSNNIKALKELNLIDDVITSGECYGGDYESINVYTSLIFSFNVLNSDAAVICCGPGVAGTSTYYGFSTLDMILPAYISNLSGCRTILIPRISFMDNRKRHYGLSMQTIAILDSLNFKVTVPVLNSDNNKIIIDVINKYNLNNRHNFVFIDDDISYIRAEYEKYMNMMDKCYKDDSYYFNNCAASGYFAINQAQQV
jgi:hypothetical protein